MNEQKKQYLLDSDLEKFDSSWDDEKLRLEIKKINYRNQMNDLIINLTNYLEDN